MFVKVSGLSLRFPTASTDLFTAVDHTFEPGTPTAVTGPSGSGKSTLLGVLADWIKPTKGSVERLGVHKTQWVFQHPVGVPRRSALDHIMLPLLAHGREVDEAAAQARVLLTRFGLAAQEATPFEHLSGGEGQRLMLAKALAVKPDLLLIDEPTAQLDRHNAVGVIDTLKYLSGSGVVVVVATHDPEVVACLPARLRLDEYVAATWP